MTRIWCVERSPRGICSPTDSSPCLSHIWRHLQENFTGSCCPEHCHGQQSDRGPPLCLQARRVMPSEGPFLCTCSERSHGDKLRQTMHGLTVAHCWGRGCPSAEPREDTTFSTAPKSFSPCQRRGLWHPQCCAGWSFNPSSLGKSLLALGNHPAKA